jgi:hypothetical protein
MLRNSIRPALQCVNRIFCLSDLFAERLELGFENKNPSGLALSKSDKKI